MPRSRSPNRDRAFLIYKYHKGNIKLKDIAEQINVSDVQIRKWKSADKWDEKLKGTLPLKSNVTNKNKCDKKEPMQQEVKEVLENTELTEKQRLFCIYYPKCFNATKAAIKAGYSKNTAYSIGWELLKKPEIKAEINKIKQNKLNKAMLSPDDIFQKYMDIAFGDITDYLNFGQEEVPVMTMYGPLKDKETGEVVTKLINTVKFKESTDIDGSIISEVSQGKDGAKIKLNDRMKALDWLAEHMDIATEEQRLKCEKMKGEINSMKGSDNDKDSEGIKNFIEATRPSEDEIKELFKDDENEKEKED